MIAYIQSLSVTYGLLLVVGSGVLLSTLGTLVANSLFTPEELIENNAVGGFKFAFLSQIVAALLAFCLVDSATRFVSFQFRCDKELAAVTLMQKLETFLPGNAERLRAAEKTYLANVVTLEWPAMRTGMSSPEVTQALENWFATAMSTKLETETDKIALAQYIRLFSQVAENRTGRVSDAYSPFENLVWISVGLAIIITISFNWFFGSYSLVTQLTMGALLTAGVMMLVYLAIALSSPINSPIGIMPNDYQALLR